MTVDADTEKKTKRSKGRPKVNGHAPAEEDETKLDDVEADVAASAEKTNDNLSPLVYPTSFQGIPVPAPKWVVKDWIPEGLVTGLYGEGGTGKSLVIQQLQTCCAIGRSWFGLETKRMKSLALYCEDPTEEHHRRQEAINQLYGCQFSDLGAAAWWPRLGYDNLLLKRGRYGILVPTDFYNEFVARAKAHGAELVFVDTVADTFGGNENDRGEVREYVQGTLGRLARDIGGTVVATAHPSRSGIKSGDQDGGSTAWSNAFRSRLSFERPAEERNEPPPHPDDRLMTRRKANYASIGTTVRMRWTAGAFATVADSVALRDRPAVENVFLILLDKMREEGRHVSSSKNAGNYAPRAFHRHVGRQDYKQAEFEGAMEKLFDQKVIMTGTYTRNRKPYECIVRVPEGGVPF